MAAPGQDGPKQQHTEQAVLNQSRDDRYDVIAVELVAENMAGTALVRLKAVESADSPGTYGLLVLNADGSAVSTGGGGAAATDNLLLETGDALLLESGDQLLLESA